MEHSATALNLSYDGEVRVKGSGEHVVVVSLHGQDSALVRQRNGVARYVLLADLETAAPNRRSRGQRPRSPRRFDRWTDDDGQEWIFDQPRRSDGSYKPDDPDTEVVESALGWYPCQGPRPLRAKHRPGPAVLPADAAASEESN